MRLEHQPVETVARILRGRLAGRSDDTASSVTVTTFAETNTLILTSRNAGALARAQAIATDLDQPTRQVQLETVFVEMAANERLEDADFDTAPSNDWLAPARALEAEGKANVIIGPKITLIAGREAGFQFATSFGHLPEALGQKPTSPIKTGDARNEMFAHLAAPIVHDNRLVDVPEVSLEIRNQGEPPERIATTLAGIKPGEARVIGTFPASDGRKAMVVMRFEVLWEPGADRSSDHAGGVRAMQTPPPAAGAAGDERLTFDFCVLTCPRQAKELDRFDLLRVPDSQNWMGIEPLCDQLGWPKPDLSFDQTESGKLLSLELRCTSDALTPGMPAKARVAFKPIVRGDGSVFIESGIVGWLRSDGEPYGSPQPLRNSVLQENVAYRIAEEPVAQTDTKRVIYMCFHRSGQDQLARTRPWLLLGPQQQGAPTGSLVPAVTIESALVWTPSPSKSSDRIEPSENGPDWIEPLVDLKNAGKLDFIRGPLTRTPMGGPLTFSIDAPTSGDAVHFFGHSSAALRSVRISLVPAPQKDGGIFLNHLNVSLIGDDDSDPMKLVQTDTPVDNQGTIRLGGWQGEILTPAEDRVPLLGSLPFLGNRLFRHSRLIHQPITLSILIHVSRNE